MARRKVNNNHICVDCGRQFIDRYEPSQGYCEAVKRECLLMYTNGMGFRAIETVKGVHHTTVIHWIRQVAKQLLDAYDPDKAPEVGELDEQGNVCGV